MLPRMFMLLSLIAAPLFSEEWDARLAAHYMDSRQQVWTTWPIAIHSGVACVSCHTGLPYLVARPALRLQLGEKSGPTLYENVLVAGLRATVIRTDADDLFAGLKGPILGQVYGAQAILAALVLAMDDARRGAALSPEGDKAFERMWSLQIKNGEDAGAWPWSDFDLDPWETKDAAFYGTALAALATGSALPEYQARPEIRQNVAAMTAYLRTHVASTSMHNRLFLLWASAKLHGLLPDAQKQAIVEELRRTQETDGGWTLASLGPWKKRDAAPVSPGSNNYATALAAFTLQQAGVRPTEAGLARAIAWLKTHQDTKRGYWAASSMNHKHDPGTIPEKFMTDAATGYAVAALIMAQATAEPQYRRK